MNRGPSLPCLIVGLAFGTVGHWLTCAARTLLKART